MNNQDKNLENVVTSGIAAASATPFRTAFKITFGIAIANLVIGLLFMSGCAAIGVVSYLVAK